MSYRNKFEESTARALKARGIPFSYEETKIDYTVTGTYLVDFEITTKKGKTIYIETKGNGRSFDHSVRKKMIAVKQQHPDLDVRIVFYSDGKIGPKRKDGSCMRQSDWANKYGFTYAIKEIPESWYE
jgi:hypothetical protein